MKRLEDMTEPELRELCSFCAEAIEQTAEFLKVEKPLFALVLFNDPKVAQYIGNCERSAIIEAMRVTADRLEQREDVTR